MKSFESLTKDIEIQMENQSSQKKRANTTSVPGIQKQGSATGGTAEFNKIL